MPRKPLPPRLYQEATGVWYIRYSANGRSQRVSTGTTDLPTAEVRLQGWLTEKRIFEEVDNDPKIDKCLKLWFDQWIAGRMLSEVRYHAIINNLNEYFGNMTVSEIQREHSRKYIEMRKRGLIGRGKAASGTIRGELQRLRACLRFMNERVEPREHRIDQEIIPYVELPPPSPPRDRVLTTEERQRIIDHCSNLVLNGPGRAPSNRMSRVGRFIMIALETAQRKTSIEELRWDQVDFDRNIIAFNPVGRLQTIKKRPTITISRTLRPVLERAKDEAINSFVLDSPKSNYEAVVAVGRDLGIDGLTPHVFRHTWATRAVMRGVPIEKVAMFLGDNIKTVRDNYEHLAPEYLDDVHE